MINDGMGGAGDSSTFCEFTRDGGFRGVDRSGNLDRIGRGMGYILVTSSGSRREWG